MGAILFLSAAGSVALADSSSAMTQQQYLRWMANICGDRLSSSASGDELVTWARGKGMNPTGGWQLNAKLTKAAVAQTIVQLLKLAPRKGSFDAVRILEREGIFISTTGGYVTVRNFVRLIDDGFCWRARPHRPDDDDGGGGDGDDDEGGGGGGGGGDDDDDGPRPPRDDDDGPRPDDDDGPRPTPTKPPHGGGGDDDGPNQGPKPPKPPKPPKKSDRDDD